MNTISLQDWFGPNVKGVVVRGALLREYNFPEDLTLLDQDILQVGLPNGLTIDVGWFPEHSPEGHFLVRVYRRSLLEQVRTPVETVYPFEVAKIVTDLVQQYCSPTPIPVSCATSVTTHYIMNTTPQITQFVS